MMVASREALPLPECLDLESAALVTYTNVLVVTGHTSQSRSKYAF